MRTESHYSCHYHIDIGREKQLVKVKNSACWYSLMYPTIVNYTDGTINKYNCLIHYTYKGPSIKQIYISDFRTNINSLAATKAMVDIINMITPCKIVTKFKETYIRYDLISESKYYNNLVLLNFLRMIWYKPCVFNHKQFFIDLRAKDRIITDPLYFLMELVNKNIVMPIDTTYNSWGNHSLVICDIIPKNVDSLLKFRGTSMNKFLTDNKYG